MYKTLFGAIHIWRPQNFGIFWPPPPLVRIWGWSTVLNSRNLPYYIFFWANLLPSPPSADVIYGCPLRGGIRRIRKFRQLNAHNCVCFGTFRHLRSRTDYSGILKSNFLFGQWVLRSRGQITTRPFKFLFAQLFHTFVYRADGVEGPQEMERN